MLGLIPKTGIGYADARQGLRIDHADLHDDVEVRCVAALREDRRDLRQSETNKNRLSVENTAGGGHGHKFIGGVFNSHYASSPFLAKL